ncbi:MAG: NmrA family NAD(P)-binding protein [Crocinitomicaceae bacterium]|nr:NmrA family NAD(P)-binding protein [Flavobacteriales bacterium]NQZ35335.1 NmrA family NAD(P)-binding protein [Crocinitomicaceae bacterium]
MKITVFGATGMIGKPVVQEMINAGFEVTAMVRDIKKAKTTLPGDVILVQGNLDNLSDIKNAIGDSEGIYISLSVFPASKQTDFHTEQKGIENILLEAKKAKIKFISYLSSLLHKYQGVDNFNWWVFDIKEKALKNIKNSGIPYICFYPSNFMEGFSESGYRQGKRISLAGKSNYPLHFISGRDYGKQLVNAFKLFNGSSKNYIIQGLESHTSDKAAQIFVGNYNKEKLSIAKAPLGILRIIGLFSPTLSYAYNITKAINNYSEKFEAKETWKELGTPKLTLEYFAKGIK